MTLETAQRMIRQAGYLWDIGQIDAKTRRWLKRQPNVTRRRALWPWLTYGTCEKTLYVLAGVTDEMLMAQHARWLPLKKEAPHV